MCCFHEELPGWSLHQTLPHAQDGKPHGKMDDSSEFIKGINAKDPRADMMMDSDSFIAANPRSLLELDRPPKSIPISETGPCRGLYETWHYFLLLKHWRSDSAVEILVTETHFISGTGQMKPDHLNSFLSSEYRDIPLACTLEKTRGKRPEGVTAGASS